MDTELQIKTIIRQILEDIRVELGDEFDMNFQRQAFFSEKWQRRRSTYRQDKSLLIDSGALRQSIQSRVEGDSVVFSSDLPYAAIHNDGGDIVVTAKMKRFFWAKYYQATGGFGRTIKGEKRQDKRNASLSTEAAFWKAMALMKVGGRVHIPRRRFLGYSPEVEKAVTDIIEDNLTEYFNNHYNIKLQ